MDTKNCPRCGAEYHADIEFCADCEIPLDSPEIEEEITTKLSKDDPASVVATGSVMSLKPLIEIIIHSGIRYRLEKLPKNPIRNILSHEDYNLLVEDGKVEMFNEMLLNTRYEEFPELAAADQLIDAGRCPACGAETGSEKACPDCGLPLVISDE